MNAEKKTLVRVSVFNAGIESRTPSGGGGRHVIRELRRKIKRMTEIFQFIFLSRCALFGIGIEKLLRGKVAPASFYGNAPEIPLKLQKLSESDTKRWRRRWWWDCGRRGGGPESVLSNCRDDAFASITQLK